MWKRLCRAIAADSRSLGSRSLWSKARNCGMAISTLGHSLGRDQATYRKRAAMNR
jgi:hypothetical protein